MLKAWKNKSSYAASGDWVFASEMTLATYAQTVGDEKRSAGKKVAPLLLKEGKVA